jgi:hypothetical protein
VTQVGPIALELRLGTDHTDLALERSDEVVGPAVALRRDQMHCVVGLAPTMVELEDRPPLPQEHGHHPGQTLVTGSELQRDAALDVIERAVLNRKGITEQD